MVSNKDMKGVLKMKKAEELIIDLLVILSWFITFIPVYVIWLLITYLIAMIPPLP